MHKYAIHTDEAIGILEFWPTVCRSWHCNCYLGLSKDIEDLTRGVITYEIYETSLLTICMYTVCIAQSVAHLTQELEVLDSIPGPATYFGFPFP